ncbi:response regulator [Halopseudomonas pachastrellae]|nr:response regulator [Halopseudomonas pachastrellae]
MLDDDPMIADFIALIVRKSGYEPTTANSVLEARGYLKEHTYAALLTDLRLKDGHGLTLIRDLRADQTTAALPILVVSAYCERVSGLHNGAAEDSAIAWLDKPVDEKNWSVFLRSYCSGQEQRPRAKAWPLGRLKEQPAPPRSSALGQSR